MIGSLHSGVLLSILKLKESESLLRDDREKALSELYQRLKRRRKRAQSRRSLRRRREKDANVVKNVMDNICQSVCLIATAEV